MGHEIGSLEDVLFQLSKHGEVTLWNTAMLRTTQGLPGWVCRVQLTSLHAGASADVKSDHKHPDPHAAAVQCLSRLLRLFEGGAITAPTLTTKEV